MLLHKPALPNMQGLDWEKLIPFWSLSLTQQQKMHTWQMKCTIDMLYADVANKI